ncbi:MAG TPA: DUF5680 domain-containing protein [Candidatus Paceibacterota bacterium]|nr:DUF5680 domain-containing protein [Candidatus Paceibacterota bacterium]
MVFETEDLIMLPIDPNHTQDKRAEARMKGYVGEACPECGNFTLMRKGTGFICDTCGTTVDASHESKTTALARPTSDEVQQVFFAAMRAGYAGDAPEKTTISELPGSKVITYQDGPWLVRDVYFIHSESDSSSGMTLIYYNGQPAWTMQYQGWYVKEVIPFLKRALAVKYRVGNWFGGRGPASYTEYNFTYRNVVKRNSFTRFLGHEDICEKSTGRMLGYHTYQGMSF